MAWMRSGVRSPSAPLTNLLLATALLGSTAACNKSSPSNPPRDAAQPRELADAGAPSTGAKAADAMEAEAAGCKSDDDCQTWSSYCQEAPCVCRVYARGEGEPRCGSSAGNVACFVDPCMKKAAACQDGRCVLVMQPAN